MATMVLEDGVNQNSPSPTDTRDRALSSSDEQGDQSPQRSYVKRLSPKEIGIKYSGREKESVSLKLDVEVLGEIETIQREIQQTDFGKYEVDLEFERPLSLQDFVNLIDIKYDTNGYPVAVQFNLFDSELVSVTVDESRSASAIQKDVDEQKGERETRSLPEPPKADNIGGKTNKQFYERLMEEENSQPRVMRKIIYEHGKLTKGELKQVVEKEGYSSTSSGFSTSLRVLDKIGEIKREGSGDEQVIHWTGS